MFTLPHWLFPGDDRPSAEIDDEIEEELRLHLDLLADQRLREGATPEEAKQQAAERFGDLDSLKRRCRVEKQGDVPMLKRLQAGFLGLLAILVIFLGVQVYVSAKTTKTYMTSTKTTLSSIQGELYELRRQIRLSNEMQQEVNATTRNMLHIDAVAKKITKTSLSGAVFKPDGKPLADADVLLIVKTWPNNRFRQDDYAVKTDEKGEFVLKGRIPFDGQYGVNAAVVADGHAIASRYVLVEDPAGREPEELVFELPESIETRILISDQTGKPLAKALIGPSARYASDDSEHLVYHQGSNPVWKKTDADGAVSVDWFAPGDLGKVRIRPRGGEWQERKFDVAEGKRVTLKVED